MLSNIKFNPGVPVLTHFFFLFGVLNGDLCYCFIKPGSGNVFDFFFKVSTMLEDMANIECFSITKAMTVGNLRKDRVEVMRVYCFLVYLFICLRL